MLVLVNSRIIDLGDAAQAAAFALAVAPGGLKTVSKTQVAWAIRNMAFSSGDFSTGDPDTLKKVAALVALKFDANAVLVLTPAGATSAAQTGIRFADISLPILAHLNTLQAKAPLSNTVVNYEVWSRAA